MNSINQTESAVFQTLDTVFPKDPFSDYSEITTAVVVPFGSRRTSPRTSILYCCFYIFLSFGTI